MAVIRPGERLRLSVAGPTETVVELDPRSRIPGPRTPEVRPVPTSPADAAAGILRVEVTIDGWVLQVQVESAARAALRARASAAERGARAGGASVLRAQIPGRVVRVWVAPGDEVRAGERLLAIEAMKMENEVRSPASGTIRSVSAAVGSAVELGDELVVIG